MCSLLFLLCFNLALWGNWTHQKIITLITFEVVSNQHILLWRYENNLSACSFKKRGNNFLLKWSLHRLWCRFKGFQTNIMKCSYNFQFSFSYSHTFNKRHLHLLTIKLEHINKIQTFLQWVCLGTREHSHPEIEKIWNYRDHQEWLTLDCEDGFWSFLFTHKNCQWLNVDSYPICNAQLWST